MKFKILHKNFLFIIINLLFIWNIFGLKGNDIEPTANISINNTTQNLVLEPKNDNITDTHLETYLKAQIDRNSGDIIILDLDVKEVNVTIYFYLSNDFNKTNAKSLPNYIQGENGHAEIRISDLPKEKEEFYIKIEIEEETEPKTIEEYIKTEECKNTTDIDYENEFFEILNYIGIKKSINITNAIRDTNFADDKNYKDFKYLGDTPDNERKHFYIVNICLDSTDCINKTYQEEITDEQLKEICTNYPNYIINIYNISTIDARKERKYLLSYKTEKYEYDKISNNDKREVEMDYSFLFENNRRIQEGKKVILTVLGNGLNDFTFKYSIIKNSDTSELIESHFIENKHFFNGYAFIIDNNIFGQSKRNLLIKFDLIAKDENDNDKNITIKTREYNKLTTINVNSHFDIKLEENEIKTECFKFDDENSEYVINFLSLTKNVNFSTYYGRNKKNKKEFQINQESMIYLINTKENNRICFEIDDTIDSLYNFGSVSFEVMEISPNLLNENVVINNEFHLIRGLSTHHFLKSNTATFYRPKHYMDLNNYVKINFHMTKGYSKLYLANCNDECQYSKEQLNELGSYPDINGFISIKKNKSPNLVAIVYCIEGECEFDIEMKEDFEKTYLYNNLRLFSFNDNEQFIINSKEISSKTDKQLLININSFNEKPDVFIYFDIDNKQEIKYEKEYFMENKLVYIINTEDIQDKEYLFVVVTGETNYYYGIYYEVNYLNNRNLENGVLYYRELDNVNFNFINKNIKKNINNNDECTSSNILNVNTFGNDLKLVYKNDNDEDEEIYSDNNLINIMINSCKSFQINANNNELNEGNPLFNMGYNENSNHNKILIEHGYMYMNRLNANNKKAAYSLILFKEQDNVNNLYVINFRKYSDIQVTITYNNNKKNINELSKMIILEENNINNCYKNNNKLYEYCELIIEIEINQELNFDEEIDFSIQVIKYEENPRYIYLPQNTFMSNMLISGFNQTYYTYINQNEEEKIYIDFFEGEGTASAEIKDKFNNSLYSNNISFDFYNKYLDINKEYSRHCGEKGCVIYIYVNLDKDTDSKYKYNIYSKKKIENAYFNVPETEYIFGHLENNVDYYKTKIKSNKLVFHINCDDCTLTIENTKKSVNISMNQEYQVYLIDGQEKTVKYNIKKNNIISNQRYYIKVISYTNELYIPVNSIRNEFCIFKLNNPCYFLIQKEHYNKVKTLRFLVTNNENIELKVEKTVINDLNELSVNENIKKDKYILNNENICEKTNYCEDGIENDKDEEIIYIIKVSLNHDDFITFVSDQYEVNSELKNYIYKEDYMIISLDTEKDSTEISPLKPVGILHYDINLIKGKGYINQLKEGRESYYLESGFKENLNLLFKKTETESSIEVHANDNNNFTFYLRIIVNSNDENNLAELSFQRNNYFKFLNNTKDLKNWPLHFYMRINTNNLDDLNDINFNYKFSISYSDSKNIYDDFEETYNAKVYLVDQNFITAKKFYTINDPEFPLNNNDYRSDLTAGYSLIPAKNILEGKNENNNNYYLYITIDKTLKNVDISNDVISVVLTLFDFTQNYILPMNEYLLMQINTNRKVNIGKKLENTYEYTPFIEFVLKKITYYILEDIEETSIYGKTFLKINGDQKYEMNLSSNGNNKERPYLFIKHGLSYFKDFSYFILTETNIQVSEDIKISFSPVKENTYNSQQNDDISYIIYNIKIYDLFENQDFEQKDIFENNMPCKLIKMINTEKVEQYDISQFIDFGLYSLGILAEARKGNIYEYLNYNPIQIEYMEKEKNITIDYNGNYTKPKYSKDIKYTATIDSKNIEKDIIKLSLRHTNSLSEDNYVFVSENEDILKANKDELYQKSKYRLLKRETALIIPVKNLKNLTNLKLYIRIPCKDICDYVFNYTLYTKDNIFIDNNECFDMELDDQPYTFKYNLKEKEKYSLFTFTSYSLLDQFVVDTDEKNELKESYFNGYSYFVDHNNYLTEEEQKTLIFNITHNLEVKICHKFEYEKDSKEIFNGDVKYTRIIKENDSECYKIYEDTYENSKKITDYRISFITKTKNLKVNLKSSNNPPYNIDIDEESKTIIFSSDYDEFCISKSGQKEGSVLFQLLSVYGKENSYYYQSMNMPLIEGVSTKQKLKKGHILFYKLKEKINNKINIHFQTLSGEPKLYYDTKKEEETDNLNITKDMIEQLSDFKGINKNIYYNKEINDNIPITIVYCPDDVENKENTDECEFYIEMSNDNKAILLNNNRKIYSFYKKEVQNDKYNQDVQNLNKYKIDLTADQFETNSEKKIYIQLYLLTGNLDLNIQEYPLSENENNYYNYNNNTRLFIIKLEDSNKSFNIEINGKKNSHYNIFYYIINSGNNNCIYLPSGEVHYNILPKSNIKYYFQLNKEPLDYKYKVTINSINCDLKVDKEINKNDYKYFQFNITSDEKVQISQNNLDVKDKCEFTISAIPLITESPKELIFNDRTYHYYHLSNYFNNINIKYFLPNLNEKSDKSVYVNINKKSDKNLTLKYKINEDVFNYTTNKYSDMIKINLTDLKEMEKIIGSLYQLNIIVENDNDIEFKIKITEDKQLYSYLDYEDIEYGIIEKESVHNYYYEFFLKNGDIEQIYLDSKGLAKIESISMENNQNTNANFQKPITHKDNFIYIEGKGKTCTNGCKVYFSVKLENCNKNNENYYNIYILSNKRSFNVFENINIYGYLNKNTKYMFTTTISDSKNIPFNINCMGCKVTFKGDNEDCSFNNSIIINNNHFSGNKLTYWIEPNEKETYYYFSVINFNKIKYIYQGESNICSQNCRFILPLYKYFSYNNNNVLLYVPDIENVIIYAKIIEKESSSYSNLNGFNLLKEENYNSSNLPITNRLLVNITEYNDKDAYMLIQVNSNYEYPFTLIVSKFYEALNNDNIIYPHNIFMFNNNQSKILLSDDKYNNYKIKMQLINGNGLISLNKDGNNGNDEYELNYEKQEIIHLINKNNYIEVKNISNDEDFILFMDIKENDKIYNLMIQKANYIKDFNINEDIGFKFDYIYSNDLYINFHFLEVKTENDGKFIIYNNTKNETTMNLLYGNNINDPNNHDNQESQFDTYKTISPFNRGFFHMKNVFTIKHDYFKLYFKTNIICEKINLVVTPLYIKTNELIELPKNTYLEIRMQNNYSISFSKPKEDYKKIKIEYASKGNNTINIISTLDNKAIVKEQSQGKDYYIINDDSMKYIMKFINSQETFLLKYTASKNDYGFALSDNKIAKTEKEENDETEKNFDEQENDLGKNVKIKINFQNIKCNNDNLPGKYKITYLIILYDWLEFYYDKEINNINTYLKQNLTIRKELTEEELKQDRLYYEIDFGFLSFAEYSLSIVGEVFYNDNVEYFSYDYMSLMVKKKKNVQFDSYWIYPLVMVVLLFIVILLFLIRAYIKRKNETNNDTGKFLLNKVKDNNIEIS